MKTAIFISVRDKATRLPGKIYADIVGRPAVERLIDRMRRAREADVVVLCTSTHPDDTKLLATAKALGIEGFAGSEDDKLDRYLRAAERHGVDFMAVVDGDDLFCEPAYIDRIIAEHRAHGGDYVIVDELPLGATAFGISLRGLRRVCERKTQRDTEVWGGYFTTDPSLVARKLAADPADRRPDLRMTLDYPEDLAFFRAVAKGAGPAASLREIIAFCDAHPDVAKINRGAQEKYEAHLKEAAPVTVRE